MATIEVGSLKLKFRNEDGRVYFTVTDLQHLPEWPESPLLELINGELFLMPSPGTEHQTIVGEIFFQLKTYIKEHKIGYLFQAPYDVIFSDEDLAIPDIVFVANKNEKIITSKNIQGTPDLIVEVVSSNRKQDFVNKRNLYEKYGVTEYIIVDVRDKIIFQYYLKEDITYVKPTEYKIDDVIPFLSISGFKLKL